MRRMNFGQRILEIFIQIGLLFYSAFICGAAWSLLFSGLGYMLEGEFLEEWKNFKEKEGTTYYVSPSYKTEEDVFGNVKVVYDNGERHDISASEFAIWCLALFALPLRCISLLFSVLALIIPPLNIKVKNNLNSRANIALDLYWY